MTFLQAVILAHATEKKFRKIGWSGALVFVENEIYWTDEYENGTIQFKGFGDKEDQLNYQDINAEWEVI